jgi:hypothetical protein
MRTLVAASLCTLVFAAACGEGTTSTPVEPESRDAVTTAASEPLGARAWNGSSSALWTRKSLDLFALRPAGPPPNSGRIGTYLALAQYRAALAAEAAGKGLPQAERPSLAGAVSGASVVVLKSFYPQHATSIDAELAAQRANPPGTVASGGDWQRDFAAGEAIGRSVGAAVLAQAATDNLGVAPLPPQPAGTGWIPAPAPAVPVKGFYGARPFFLTSNTEINAPPPPAVGSPTFVTSLAAVRAYSDGRTPEQVAITTKWVPFSDPLFNGKTVDLLMRYHVDELESARILAYSNAASFDALIGCFETKYVYWFVRPTQADPGITLATGLPNHPSYPSAHSCSAGAYEYVLADAFPQEREGLAAMAEESRLSRELGGLHYDFDGFEGLALGRRAGALALERRGLE